MEKMLMKGNEAIAEAAIRAGCKHYFGYPITPQSEVAEYLAKRLPEEGGVFLQGESEVAVGYMLFGTAGCGERVFTTSSSPGISLMSEAISYIAAAELPVVFVNIMRGGPGLGGILPSQSDYFQATKGGGHGDYRLLVLAPANIQEAVEMVMDAFPLAEKYRNPVMIMGDGLIGQMMEPVQFPETPAPEPCNKNDWATCGMATRGSDTPNVVKSLYLDSSELFALNRKLKAKYRNMASEVRYETDNIEADYEILLVGYGTMSRVCRTAIKRLEEDGIKAAMLRPQTLYPFPEVAVREAAGKTGCKVVLTVELSMGQMVEDVERSVRGRCPVEFYGKAGGEMITPEEVADCARELLKA